MLLSAVSVLVVAQSSSEIPEGLMNNPVHVVLLAAINYYIITTHNGLAAIKAFRLIVVN